MLVLRELTLTAIIIRIVVAIVLDLVLPKNMDIKAE